MYDNPYNSNPYSYTGNNFQNPFQQFPVSHLTRQEIIKVSGEGGARAYNMAPNSSALLLDETGSLVWLKTTDGAGFPTVTPYSISPYQPEPVVSDNNYKELLERVQKLEERLMTNESHTTASNGKQKSQ